MKTDTAQTIDPAIGAPSNARISIASGWFYGLLKHIALLAFGFVMLYPVLWMIASSFRPQSEIFGTVGLIPRHFTIDNYIIY